MKKLLFKSLFLLCALVVGSTSGWAADQILTLTQSALGLTGGYTTNTEKTVGGITFVYTDLMKNNDDIQAKASSGVIYNKTAFPTNIKSVAITHNQTARSTTIWGSSNGTDWTQIQTGSGSITGDFSSNNYKYFKITRGSNAAYWEKIEITYAAGSSTPTCATPTFSIAAGTYASAQSVTISTTTEDATIHYTTDGSTPTTSSSTYSSAIPVSATTTIKAIAVKANYDNSAVASATYNFVTIEHAGTEADPYTVADARNAIDATDGTKTNVYVTGIVCTGGSDFGNNALNYWISDDGTETNQLEAYRGKNLNNTNFTAVTDVKVGEIVTIFGSLTKFNSTYEFSSGNYLVSHKKKPATPTFSPAAGTYTSAQNVTLSCVTDGATIYYTMGDAPADPTSASTPYTAAINVNANATIKAIAIKEGVSSDVAIAAYTINTAPFVTVSSNSIEVENTGDNGTITATYGNLTNFLTDVVFYESNGTDVATYDHSWILTDFDASNNLEYVIGENTENATRTAYLKIYAVGDEGDTYSELITITQASANYATLPFAWAGGTSAGLLALTGVTASGLGSDYAAGNAPYRIKMDNEGDYIQIKTNTQPGKVSIGIKKIGGDATSKIKIQESADGTNFTDVEELTISGSQNAIVNLVMTNTFTTTTRYVRIYKSKHGTGGNIGVGPINIAQANEPSIPIVSGSTISLTTTTNMAGWRTFAPVKADQKYTADADVYYVSAAGSSSVTLVKIEGGVPANTPVILHKTDGTTITLTETDDAITAPGTSNLLAVSTADQNLGTVYRLGYKSAYGVGFYTYTTTSAPEGIVYINPSSSAHEFLGLDFDGETTGVNEVTNTNLTNNTNGFYNLAGQRVAQPTKGLYIVNGRKVIIK
jgi:hypothetical protein